MAKLKARGRTEVYRVQRNRPDDESMTGNVQIMVLMSDGKVLISSRGNWRPETSNAQYGNARYNSGWKVRGKLKAGYSPDDFLKNALDKGWTRV